MTKLFTPTGFVLNHMMARAMQKCDGDVEQTRLRNTYETYLDADLRDAELMLYFASMPKGCDAKAFHGITYRDAKSAGLV